MISNRLQQGSSIRGPQAKSGLRRSNNWPTKQHQNAEEIYSIFFKIHVSVLTVNMFIFFINEKIDFIQI